MQRNFEVAYHTKFGDMYSGFAERILALPEFSKKYQKRIQLILTSPPFPLNHKKKYGNFQGAAYVNWLASFAQIFRKFLKRNGSVIIEIGNAWEPRQPTMSTLALEALLSFKNVGQFHLCQQFICYNPARLPSPAQWVNVKRIRVKDSFTHIWWMAPGVHPKANNRRVLKPYSSAMLKLLASKKYNAGLRPSEHHIGRSSFLKNNRGAIPSNVLSIANTRSNDSYQTYCRQHKLQTHPARMPADLAGFFIKFLTQPGDLVLDPFAGSNTTGAVAELLKRRWVSIESNTGYIKSSIGRFDNRTLERLRL